MNKLLLAVPVIAGVAGASWAGTTLYSGSESRTAYERVIADLNETLGLAVVTTEYVPGFLQSEATTEVLLTDGLGADALFRLRHVIEHSPVGTGANAGLSAARVITTVITEDIDNELVAEVLQGFGGKQPVTLLSRVGFDGTVDNEFTIAPFEYAYDRGAEVRSEAAVWNFSVDSEGSYAGSGHWGGAVVETPMAIVNVAQMNDSFNYTRHSSGLYQGNYEQNYTEVRVTAPQVGLSTGIRDVDVSLLSDITQGKLSGNFVLAINDIDAPIALDTAELAVRFGGLGIEGLKQLNEVESQLLAADFDADPATGEQLIKDYASALGGWVEPGAYFGYDVSLGNAGGTADASITATFDGDDSPTGHDLLTSPDATQGDLLRAMKIEASLNAPDEALALTPVAMFLDPAMLAPWIVADGSGLTSNILVDDMIADINGDPMQLEMMLGDELYAPLNLHEILSL